VHPWNPVKRARLLGVSIVGYEHCVISPLHNPPFGDFMALDLMNNSVLAGKAVPRADITSYMDKVAHFIGKNPPPACMPVKDPDFNTCIGRALVCFYSKEDAEAFLESAAAYFDSSSSNKDWIIARSNKHRLARRLNEEEEEFKPVVLPPSKPRTPATRGTSGRGTRAGPRGRPSRK
jgi:hypothetical protein